MNNPPKGIFATNYEMTLGAIMAVNEKDIKIPDQVYLIGFDNIQMAKVIKPSLSIVVQPMEQIGETAAHVLLKRLNGDHKDSHSIHSLKTQIVIKDSVKAIVH
ncbi:MAG TPA: substrate-binding domain-containing protein [Clostridia bacterium]|nr:substrate-binding domain-containing protein [Clostridia bacterium]